MPKTLTPRFREGDIVKIEAKIVYAYDGMDLKLRPLNGHGDIYTDPSAVAEFSKQVFEIGDLVGKLNSELVGRIAAISDDYLIVKSAEIAEPIVWRADRCHRIPDPTLVEVADAAPRASNPEPTPTPHDPELIAAAAGLDH